MMKFFHVGTVPRWTLLTSVSGDSTSTQPRITSASWVEKSVNASTTLTPAASLTPTMLIAQRITITAMPTMMSPGEVFR